MKNHFDKLLSDSIKIREVERESPVLLPPRSEDSLPSLNCQVFARHFISMVTVTKIILLIRAALSGAGVKGFLMQTRHTKAEITQIERREIYLT